MNFTIPRTTPPGKYLMRVEQLYPLSSRFNDTQFYIACAQLDIKGPGGGNASDWPLDIYGFTDLSCA